jgi:hypothetical protein
MNKKGVSIRDRKKELKGNGYSKNKTSEIINHHRENAPSKAQKKLERIAESIIPIFPEEINGKKYLHYCSYFQHPGVIGEKHLEKKDCINKGCYHYQRFVLE